MTTATTYLLLFLLGLFFTPFPSPQQTLKKKKNYYSGKTAFIVSGYFPLIGLKLTVNWSMQCQETPLLHLQIIVKHYHRGQRKTAKNSLN